MATAQSTILIVDDEPFNLDLLEQELDDEYAVVRAENGVEALEKAESENPDLILLDIRMPEMDGLEAVRKLRESAKHVTTPVIMLTAQSTTEEKVEGLDAGADDYITKPFDPDDLHARIRSNLRIGRLQRELAEERNELKQALDDLRAAEVQLVHSEKMAGLGKLVAGVAHELNNPIGFIYANMGHFQRYVGQLREMCEASGFQGEAAEKAEKTFSTLDRLVESCSNGAQRIKEIVLGLRAFSRLDEAERKTVDVHEGIDSTLTLLEHHMKDRITVTKDYGDLPLVECMPGQLNQVFVNLLTNAVDAVEGEGEVVITTRTEGDEHVSIGIRDTGAGIPDDVRSRIFEPFYTTKDVGKGTGLGLSISYGIVEKHGGSIAVESAAGEGTTFVVRLPVRMGG